MKKLKMQSKKETEKGIFEKKKNYTLLRLDIRIVIYGKGTIASRILLASFELWQFGYVELMHRSMH